MIRLMIKTASYFMLLTILSTALENMTAGVLTAALAAVLLAVLNTLLRPILIIVALPFNLFLFGSVSILVNVLMLKITDALIAGLSISKLWMLCLAGLSIMAVDTIIYRLRAKEQRAQNSFAE